MNALLAKIPAWAYLTLAVLTIIGLVTWCTTQGTRQPTELTKRQEAAVQASINRNQAAAGTDTLAASRAAASGTTSYQAGQAYETIATILHHQSIPYAPHPTPLVSDTAAARLQRQLANYAR